MALTTFGASAILEARKLIQAELAQIYSDAVDTAFYSSGFAKFIQPASKVLKVTVTTNPKESRMSARASRTRRRYLLGKWDAQIAVEQGKCRILGKAVWPAIEIAQELERNEAQKRQTQRQAIQASKHLHKAQRWDGHRP